MTLKRTVDVPKTEPVEFVRHAKIVGRDTCGTRLMLRLSDEIGRLGHKARCLVSEDAAGDRMRGVPLVCEGYYTDGPGAPECALFNGQTGTETAGDWLWVEVPRSQESLQEVLRRQINPGGALSPFPLGELIGGGRRQ